MPPQSPISSPCADAWRGLVPSGTRRAVVCPHFPPGSPLRVVTARYRLASPTSRSEPRLLSARTLRGSALPAPPLSSSLPCAPLYPRRPPLSPLSFCRMGWRPRSRGACGQTVSPVRSGAPPLPRVSGGGGARRVDRGEERGVPRSAEPRSVRDQPPAPARVTRPHIAPPLRLILYLHRSILYPRRPLLSPPAGWGGALGAAERAGRWYPRFGAARRHCHALAGRGSAPRRPGGGARRPPFGRAAEPARSAACASPGHPPPHSARTPSTPRPCPALSSIPTALSPLSSLLLPDGLASSEPRSVRADGIPGSERSAATATRQRGGGARRVDRGEERAVPRSAELRSVRDQPPAPAQATRRHIAPSPPRAPLLPPPHPPPAKRQKKVVPTRRVGTTL